MKRKVEQQLAKTKADYESELKKLEKEKDHDIRDI